MLFFLVSPTILAKSNTSGPQIVITDTAPEILPMNDSVTYNISTDDRGVITVTTLDQGTNTSVAQTEVNPAANRYGTVEQEFQTYAPTAEEITNSMNHPIIKVSDYQPSHNNAWSSGGQALSNYSSVPPNTTGQVRYDPPSQSQIGQGSYTSSQGTAGQGSSDPPSQNLIGGVLGSTTSSDPQTKEGSSKDPNDKSKSKTSKDKKDKKKKKKTDDDDDPADEPEVTSGVVNYKQFIVEILILMLSHI
ncbi:putative SP-containing protein [Vairimorpha necatrix]|uniref:SP-containing protein n=1 Tax=Vairimorpha necatrix TaxID=6039 RepID=A0AAX4JCS4_9MICR